MMFWRERSVDSREDEDGQACPESVTLPGSCPKRERVGTVDSEAEQSIPSVKNAASVRSDSTTKSTISSASGNKMLSARFGNLPVGLDKDAMRESVRVSLIKPTFHVHDLYHDFGVFQAIARHPAFSNATMFVIFLNSIWIWIDTDFNDAQVFTQSLPHFQIVEYLFCIIFTLEWCIRFQAFSSKWYLFKDSWFMFDSFLVLTMVLESWVMSAVILLFSGGGNLEMGDASVLRIMRLLRLSRMARMVRLFRAMPELLILVKGIIAATRSVIFTLVLLIILLYVFSIAFRQLSKDTPMGDQHFANVPEGMYTLLIDGTLMDNLGPLARRLGEESSLMAGIFWVFVLLSSFTVMNMLIGVLCEVVSAVATTEKEAMMVNFVKERMKPLFKNLDRNEDNLITKDEFLSILGCEESVQLLEEVGVDTIFLIDQADDLFREDMVAGESRERFESQSEKSMRFEDLMHVILDLRGENKATVKHIVELRRHILMAIQYTNESLMDIQDTLSERLPSPPEPERRRAPPVLKRTLSNLSAVSLRSLAAPRSSERTVYDNPARPRSKELANGSKREYLRSNSCDVQRRGNTGSAFAPPEITITAPPMHEAMEAPHIAVHINGRNLPPRPSLRKASSMVDRQPRHGEALVADGASSMERPSLRKASSVVDGQLRCAACQSLQRSPLDKWPSLESLASLPPVKLRRGVSDLSGVSTAATSTTPSEGHFFSHPGRQTGLLRANNAAQVLDDGAPLEAGLHSLLERLQNIAIEAAPYLAHQELLSGVSGTEKDDVAQPGGGYHTAAAPGDNGWRVCLPGAPMDVWSTAGHDKPPPDGKPEQLGGDAAYDSEGTQAQFLQHITSRGASVVNRGVDPSHQTPQARLSAIGAPMQRIPSSQMVTTESSISSAGEL